MSSIWKNAKTDDRAIMVDADNIVVGQHFRKKLTGMDSLKASLERVGLLHPLLVKPANEDGKHELVAGFRRLNAIRELGGGEIACRIPNDIDDAREYLEMERDENEEREPLTPSEAVALGEALEALEAPKAAERQAEGGKTKAKAKAAGRTRAKVAAAVGMSEGSYAGAKEVVQAAREFPEETADVAKKMDETGKIAPAVKKARARLAKAGKKLSTKKESKAKAEKPKLPTIRLKVLSMEDGETRPVTCPCCKAKFVIKVS